MAGDVKFPKVKVKLIGEDGNAFAIMGRAMAAARLAGVSREDVNAYMSEATGGDYDHLIATTCKYFSCK